MFIRLEQLTELAGTTVSEWRLGHHKCLVLMLVDSRAPIGSALSDRPPCSLNLQELEKARGWSAAGAGQWQDHQCSKLIRHSIRGGREGQQDVVPRPQLHRGHV